MLTDEQFKNLWPEIKLGLRNLWGRLDEEELDQTGADFSAIASLVQAKYSEDRSSIKQKLEQLLESFDNDTDKGLDPDSSSYRRTPFNEDWNARH